MRHLQEHPKFGTSLNQYTKVDLTQGDIASIKEKLMSLFFICLFDYASNSTISANNRINRKEKEMLSLFVGGKPLRPLPPGTN